VAARVGPGGQALGVDVSADSAAAARAAAANAGLTQVQVLTGRMEDLATLVPPDARFSLAVSCFSLYYAGSPESVLRDVHELLAPGGRLFVCGPALANNAEFLAFVDSVVPRPAQTLRRDDSLRFMEETAPPLFSRHFEDVSMTTFENPVVFPTPDDLVRYWRSYHLYSPAHEDAFAEAARAHFAREGRFMTRKVVRGALMRVEP
jgi:SAM-dependent methyltransferase